MKKLVLGLVLLSVVNVSAQLQPSPQNGVAFNNEDSLKDKIVQKWEQFANKALVQMRGSGEGFTGRLQKKYGQDTTLRLMDSFLRECN
ncbi:hypothetical protein [Candidatus Paracaedibacter symbiosus]|uniref:hypothetical protein n=1 Tax=Candidatus Paracaedibacter symbiosus TaxID=244582 RepID=UPI000509980F|nr:hypothetical protein [Candidatus Paracaedibacter symbiosus]